MPNLNIAEMGNGAFSERFTEELQKALENIADLNTDPTKVRTVTLVARLKSDEHRDMVSVDVSVKSSLVPAKSLTTKLLVDKDREGNVIGAELKSGKKGQTYLDCDGSIKDDKGKVISISK
ncbi:MAG: hypothetical protein JM58_09125 [Peptococcaceae bacterium BICA1-8]|nr:MAG: hypothetical protein JM58_09125 [Peptococcaceae bacterium BICA1-8]